MGRTHGKEVKAPPHNLKVQGLTPTFATKAVEQVLKYKLIIFYKTIIILLLVK
jgi:hypothetical protein